MNQTELLRTLMNALQPVWYLAGILVVLATILLLPWYRRKAEDGLHLMRVLPWAIIGVFVVSTALMQIAYWNG